MSISFDQSFFYSLKLQGFEADARLVFVDTGEEVYYQQQAAVTQYLAVLGNIQTCVFLGNIQKYILLGNIQKYILQGNIQKCILLGNIQKYILLGNTQKSICIKLIGGKASSKWFIFSKDHDIRMS